MLIVNRYYRENGTLGHSTEFFPDAKVENGIIPEEINANLLKKIAADVQREGVDYCMCQIIDSKGSVWKTELGKSLPLVNA